jgi:hypothetical protein
MYGAASSASRCQPFWYTRSAPQCNQSCKISYWSVDGFRFGRYLKIVCFQKKAWSSLTQCLALPRLHVTTCSVFAPIYVASRNVICIFYQDTYVMTMLCKQSVHTRKDQYFDFILHNLHHVTHMRQLTVLRF